LKLRAVRRIDQVARLVGLPRLDQRDVGFSERSITYWFSPSNSRISLPSATMVPYAGLGEERRDARAAGAQLLGQRALRREFELEFAGQVLALELLVLADVGRDHLLDLARREQLAEAEAVDARVVGDDRSGP
jgi:hypothetical protein